MSLEILLDAASETAIREDWERLRAAGHSNLAASTAVANRPHITAIVRSHLPAPDLSGIDAFLPRTVWLGAPTVFPHAPDARRGILVRTVDVSPELEALHRWLHARSGPGADLPHTTPGQWTPHVTLARRLALTQLSEAISVLAPASEATLVGLRRWDGARRESRVLWTA